jgi:excisionase family DNA binding protein
MREREQTNCCQVSPQIGVDQAKRVPDSGAGPAALTSSPVHDEPGKRLAYSVPELCQATSLGRSLIYEEIRNGRLKATKVGARTLILRGDAEAWLQSLR